MSLEICTYGNPILRKKAKPVQEVTPEIIDLANQMFEAMYKERGVGLAAEQIGRNEAIFIIDIPPESDMDKGERENPDIEMPLVFINPKIISHGEDIQIGQEGCLSFPEIYANVERWYEVDVEFLNKDGEQQTLHTKGLLARAVQHELDHLNGILLVDRMSPVKKIALSGKLKKLVKQSKMKL